MLCDDVIEPSGTAQLAQKGSIKLLSWGSWGLFLYYFFFALLFKNVKPIKALKPMGLRVGEACKSTMPWYYPAEKTSRAWRREEEGEKLSPGSLVTRWNRVPEMPAWDTQKCYPRSWPSYCGCDFSLIFLSHMIRDAILHFFCNGDNLG